MTLWLTVALCSFGIAQVDDVKGNLVSDTADLTILNIFPDSFPNVSVVFKAETRKGEPCWNLTKDKMHVQENGQTCSVLSIDPISKNHSVDLGIVIDHSGSMAVDESMFTDSTWNTVNIDSLIMTPSYKSPLQNAKDAVKTFITGFTSKEDFISVIGFSSAVSQRLSLTQNTAAINAAVDSMRPDGNTALYDAMISGLEELKNPERVNVLVVLTDGFDNVSKSKYSDVIKKAEGMNIPIYIIGLGGANKDTLNIIADSTKGKFYYSKKSSSLVDVYNDISKHIQAFYDLVYESPNLSAADSTRQIRIWFQVDSIQLLTNPSQTNLPKEVVTCLKKKETERSYMMYGGIAIIGLIAAGTILFRTRRSKTQKKVPVILNLYPNPSDGNITLNYSGSPGQLQIIGMDGHSTDQIPISEGSNNFDLSKLANGNYVATVIAAGQKSNALKFIIQK